MNEGELIDLYKTLLEQQSQSYSNLITAFIGITALIVGSTWLWNFFIARNQIRLEVSKKMIKVIMNLEKK